MRLAALTFGAAFGALLAWAHLDDPQVIHDMLLLREFDVFLLMGSAVATAFVGCHLLRLRGARSVVGSEPISWTPTRPDRDHVIGSVVFGIGWAIASTCPGPLAVQVATGRLAALATLAGVATGIALRRRRSAAAVGEAV